MYEPKYEISERLLDLIVKLETDKAILGTYELPHTVKQKTQDDSKVLSIFHLAHLLGLNITIKDAEKLVEGRKLENIEIENVLLNNFRNIIEFNRSTVADSYVDLDLSLILHLNKLMLATWKESWEIKLRVDEPLDKTFDDWVKDNALPGDVAQEQLRELIDWYKIAGVRVYPLLRIAILIYRLTEIMPFVAGNKLTIIAIADCLLYRYGYTSRTFVPITRTFDLNNDEYKETWDICSQNYDLTLWLENFVRSFGKEIAEGRVDLDRSVAEEKDKTTKQPFLDLNKRQLKILRYLQTIPTVKREDYCQMMDVSTMTAYRDLTYLVDKKLIKIEGEGRGTRYMLVTR